MIPQHLNKALIKALIYILACNFSNVAFGDHPHIDPASKQAFSEIQVTAEKMLPTTRIGKVKVRKSRSFSNFPQIQPWLDSLGYTPESLFPQFLSNEYTHVLIKHMLLEISDSNPKKRSEMLEYKGCEDHSLHGEFTKLVRKNRDPNYQKTCKDIFKSDWNKVLQFEFHVRKSGDKVHQAIAVTSNLWTSGALFIVKEPIKDYTRTIVRTDSWDTITKTFIFPSEGEFSQKQQKQAKSAFGLGRFLHRAPKNLHQLSVGFYLQQKYRMGLHVVGVGIEALGVYYFGKAFLNRLDEQRQLKRIAKVIGNQEDLQWRIRAKDRLQNVVDRKLLEQHKKNPKLKPSLQAATESSSSSIGLSSGYFSTDDLVKLGLKKGLMDEKGRVINTQGHSVGGQPLKSSLLDQIESRNLENQRKIITRTHFKGKKLAEIQNLYLRAADRKYFLNQWTNVFASLSLLAHVLHVEQFLDWVEDENIHKSVHAAVAVIHFGAMTGGFVNGGLNVYSHIGRHSVDASRRAKSAIASFRPKDMQNAWKVIKESRMIAAMYKLFGKKPGAIPPKAWKQLWKVYKTTGSEWKAIVEITHTYSHANTLNEVLRVLACPLDDFVIAALSMQAGGQGAHNHIFHSHEEHSEDHAELTTSITTDPSTFAIDSINAGYQLASEDFMNQKPDASHLHHRIDMFVDFFVISIWAEESHHNMSTVSDKRQYHCAIEESNVSCRAI